MATERVMRAMDVQGIIGTPEKLEYDASFTLFTWEQWMEMQTTFVHCFARYQRAIERKQPQLALLIVLQLHEILGEMHKEACAWIDTNAGEG